MCKISLQKRKKNFLKANSKSVSVNLKIYGKLPNKSVGCLVGALAENQIVKHGTKSISKTFKFLFNPCSEFTWKTSKSAKSICD